VPASTTLANGHSSGLPTFKGAYGQRLAFANTDDDRWRYSPVACLWSEPFGDRLDRYPKLPSDLELGTTALYPLNTRHDTASA